MTTLLIAASIFCHVVFLVIVTSAVPDAPPSLFARCMFALCLFGVIWTWVSVIVAAVRWLT